MKVYPLIYSRTKFAGYVNGFMVRPKDLDYRKAESYVGTIIETTKNVGGIRYAVFSVGEYAVYNGTFCYTTRLVEKLGEKLNGEDYQEYQADESGRPLNFFIGFAIKKGEYNGNVPDIDLLGTYQIYLEYLKKQFKNTRLNTKTEELSEGIEVNEISCQSDFTPDESDSVDGIKILKNYDSENYQNIINYYFKQIMEGENKNISFVTDILRDDINPSMPYTRFSISKSTVDRCIAKLKQQQENPQPKQKISQFVDLHRVEDDKENQSSKKKSSSCLVICLVVIILLILLIGFLKK